MSVRNTSNGGIQLVRNFKKAEEMLNIHAAHETVFAPQMNLTKVVFQLLAFK
jgi:hypothetical protein